jgi:hypothetical protein
MGGARSGARGVLAGSFFQTLPLFPNFVVERIHPRKKQTLHPDESASHPTLASPAMAGSLAHRDSTCCFADNACTK